MADDNVRNVRFTAEENLDAVPLRVRTDALTLKPGVKIQVEVGGRWAPNKGGRTRVEGHWVDCVVVNVTPRDVLVQLVRS